MFDAETVLLVNDRESQFVEFDGVLNERVGADYDLRLAGSDHVLTQYLFFGAQRTGKEHDFHAERLEQGLEFKVVLLGKNFGGSHECRLVAAVNRLKSGQGRDNRFSAADVTLNQTVHRSVLRKVGVNLHKDALLRSR